MGVDFLKLMEFLGSHLQNLDISGKYLLVAEQERQDILANFPDFFEEGVAFKVDF